MKKTIALILITALLMCSLSACFQDIIPEGLLPFPKETDPTPQQTEDTQPSSFEPAASEPQIGSEDTYWIGDAYYSEESASYQPFEEGVWYMDLLIRQDGTARFRDIHESICLTDDSYQFLRWEFSQEGTLLFYNHYYSEPVLSAAYENGILTLNYLDMLTTLHPAPVPQTPGESYLPAELAGTWILVSGETEGYEWEAMPMELSSLEFHATYDDGLMILVGAMVEWDTYGNQNVSDYNRKVTVLDEPLYAGCENALWSVRIGDASPVDASGNPTQTEFYATLLSYNLLLLQRYYTMDGYPAVSYQTYARFTDLVSWSTPEYLDLGYTTWTCSAYTDLSGNYRPIPAEMADLSLVLNEDGSCSLWYGDTYVQKGSWQLGHGGMLLLRGNEGDFWYGGAVSSYCVETSFGMEEVRQMALYYQGGILKLMLNSYG